MEADERYDGMMAVTDYIDDEKPLYVQTDDDLNITAFRDERYDGAKYISGGIYALNEKAIDVLPTGGWSEAWRMSLLPARAHLTAESRLRRRIRWGKFLM